MSHVANVKVQVKDLDALSDACTNLGLVFLKDQKTYKWYSGRNKCDHAIGVAGAKGAYEVGVKQNADGTWGFEADFYDQRLTRLVGNDCKKLMTEYAKCAARNETKRMAKRFGYSWSEQINNHTGEVVITMRQY